MREKPKERHAKINFQNYGSPPVGLPDGTSPVTFVRDSRGNISAYTDTASGDGGGSSDLYSAGIDDPPASAGSLDDEFNDTSFDTGRWTDLNNVDFTKSQNGRVLNLHAPNSVVAERIQGITQTCPSTPWEVTAKIAWSLFPAGTGFYKFGLLVYETSSGRVITINLTWQGTSAVAYQVNTFNSVSSHNGIQETFVWPDAPWTYMRIKDDGSNLIFSISINGYSYHSFTQSRTAWFTSGPDRVGIFINNNQAGQAIDMYCDWFRRTV